MQKILSMVCVVLTSTSLFSQYRLDEGLSSIYVNGTSKLHDWEVSVHEMKGDLEVDIEKEVLKKIKKVNINIPVNALKGEKSGMDERMYEALKSKQFPIISYEAKQLLIQDDQTKAIGEITIAGVTRSIVTLVSYLKIGKYLKFSGQFNLNITDYNIEPPEFLFGAFKIGDEVSINFHFMFYNKIDGK